MTVYLGKVSCDLHKCASRVRVQIEGTDGIPLSVKASLNNYPRVLFKKGVAVEVEQANHDGRVFHVTQVLEPVRKSVHLNFQITVPNANAFKRNQTMENRVRFFIGCKYLQNNAIYSVMRNALGLDDSVARELYRRATDGFWVICREEQFARFMVYRNNAGVPNGFMDLRATIIQAVGDVYERIASAAGVDRGAVKKVLLALNYDRVTVEERLEMRTAEVDVSQHR